MDIVQKWVDENCIIDKDKSEKSIDLFDNFSLYVQKNREYQLTHTMFGRNLSKKFEKRKRTGSTFYLGLRLIKGYVLTKEEEEHV